MKSIDNEKIIVIFPANQTNTGPRGAMLEVAKHAHVHLSSGKCYKNRYARRCN